MKASELISLIGVFVGLGAFISGYIQYVKAQKWKRAEFVAKEIKEFEAKPKIKLAMQLLDWNARKYDIGDSDDEKEILIHDRILGEALRPHNERSSFNPTEVFIRDVFDAYFDSLERFDHFIESGLVTPEEFRSYLTFYGYTGVINLLSRYGYIVSNTRS